MDRNKKFMLILSGILIVVTLVFLKLFVIKTTGSDSSDTLEISKAKPLNKSDVDKESLSTDKGMEKEIKELDVELSKSDKVIRQMLSSISDIRGISRFLNFNNIVERFTAAVDNIARGESPSKNLDFLEPFEKFKPEVRNGKIEISESSYRRYDRFVRIFDSFESKKLVGLYLRSKGLIDKAYKNLGYGNEDFDDTLYDAIKILLNTPEIEGEVLLKKGIITYKFENRELESLNGAEKHFLRMGLKNIRTVKKKLREIGYLLGFKFKIRD